MNVKFGVTIKITHVLINPVLFVKMKESGDIVHKYSEDRHYLWGKYLVRTDSNVDDIDFNFELSTQEETSKDGGEI